MQECCFHSLPLSGTVLLSFHSFPLFFSTLFSPKWGSPLMQREGVRLPVSFARPAALGPLLPCLHSSALIWRSQGTPPPPSTHTCVECKHSHLLCRDRKQGQLIGTVDLTPRSVCCLKAMSVRVPFWTLPSPSGCALALTVFPSYLAAAAKVKDFLFCLGINELL